MNDTLNTEKKEYRLWKPVNFGETWAACDTSVLDDISASWFRRRVILQENSLDYVEFLEQLKREHAIETGVVERLYDLGEGITETFIKEGFVQSLLTHGDTNIDKNDLMNHLNDHLEAVNFVFDIVKENRPLNTGFINQLHQLTTLHQKYAEGRDQFGRRGKVKLLKGKYKERENNPTKADGTVIMYCPPGQTVSEMDNLVTIYNDLTERKVHPLIIATWFHHAFTTIHPYQDGNGRVARLLTSLIFIKYNFFPLTVNRHDKIAKYFKGLQKADIGQPQDLVQYFGEIQKQNIEKALNVKEVASTSFKEVQQIFTEKVENWVRKEKEEKIKEENERYQRKLLIKKKVDIHNYCIDVLNEIKSDMMSNLDDNVKINVGQIPMTHIISAAHHYKVAEFAQKYNYHYPKRNPFQSWVRYEMVLPNEKIYYLLINLHHYGYDEDTIAMASFLKFGKGNEIPMIALEIPPHVISLVGNVENKKKNIKKYLENAMTITLAQIASEI